MNIASIIDNDLPPSHGNRQGLSHGELAVLLITYIVSFEQLKGWRPKGGRKSSTLKQRFHGWLHRALVNLTQEKFTEAGGRTEFVFPRGTSSFAFDGSGKVKRSKKNYSLATFSSGKQYNCDLSASYNIGARYWAKKLKLTRRNDSQLDGGKSSSSKRRTPVTLSVLWKDKEAPTTAT